MQQPGEKFGMGGKVVSQGMLCHSSINMLVLGNKQGNRFKVKPKGTGSGSLNQEGLWSGHHHITICGVDRDAEGQPNSLTLTQILRVCSAQGKQSNDWTGASS